MIPLRHMRIFPCPQRPDQLWGPSGLLDQWCSAWGTRRHVREYAKTSYGSCKNWNMCTYIHAQKNDAVSKVDKKCISYPTRAQLTTVQVSHTLITILQCVHLGHTTHPHGNDRLCGLVVRVPGYRSRGPGSSPSAQPREYNWGATWKKK
jgi:hypothetical protein